MKEQVHEEAEGAEPLMRVKSYRTGPESQLVPQEELA